MKERLIHISHIVKTTLLFFSVCLVACSPRSQRQAEPAVAYDTLFTTCYQTSHGAYYTDGGLENNVVSLDLYSEGLTLNNQGMIEGTGTNLYFSDLFLPDSIRYLLPGTYTSDTTGNVFTFLPGTSFQGNFTGAYLLSISGGELVSYRLLPAGTLSVSVSDSVALRSAFKRETVVYTLRFAEPSDSRTKYHAAFEGLLRN